MSTEEMNNLRGDFRDLKQFLVQEFAVVNGRLTNIEEHVAAVDRNVATLNRKVTALDQRVATLDQKVTTLDQRVTILDRKLDDLTAWTIETVDTMNETNAAQFKDHGMRLAFLEHKAV